MVLALIAGKATAASIVLSSSAMRSPGEFRVDMWFEDSTRDATFHWLTFGIDHPRTGPGSVPSLDPFQLPNTQRCDLAGNPLVDGDGELGPFDLQETIVEIHRTLSSIDTVHVVLSSSDRFDLNALAAQWNAFPVCTGAACLPQQTGLAQNRLYLGSFYMFLPNGELGDGPPVLVMMPPGTIAAQGDTTSPYEVDPLQVELQNQLIASGGVLKIEGLAPEPESISLFGLALAAVRLARRWA
jgi:hypothetical protein